MIKRKKLNLLLLFIPFFSLFVFTSCQQAKDPYDGNIIQYSEENKRFEYDDTNFTKVYKSGESLNLNGLAVTFDKNPINLFEGSDSTKLIEKQFFITRSNLTPTISFVKPSNYKLTSNAESADMSFYLGVLIKEDNVDKIYVSRKLTITVKNEGALKPWVWFVVSGVVIFGVVAMVFFTKRYKATH